MYTNMKGKKMRITATNNTPLQKQQTFEGNKGHTFKRGLKEILEARFGKGSSFDLLSTDGAQKLDRAVFDANVIIGGKEISPVVKICRTAEGSDTFTISATASGTKRSLEMKPSDMVDYRDPFDVLILNIQKTVAWLGQDDNFVNQEKAANSLVKNPESTAMAELREGHSSAPLVTSYKNIHEESYKD